MGVIVVGVDGSEPAERAARTAAGLAAALGSELQVVCAYGAYQAERVEDERDLVFTNVGPAADAVDGTVRRLGEEFPALTISAQTAARKPADALISVAVDTDADLIVVGNRRVQGAARILGSVATEVARKAPCDLYIAHTHDRK